MNNEMIDGEIVSVETSVNQALAQITKAEIDQQIATAHAYPRSLAKFKQRALEMATLDEETAESCIYSRPVGKNNGKQEFAEGMSIRMAEIVGACFGNLRVGSMLVEMTPRHVKARGFAHDLETNFASTSEVIESTVNKQGQPFSERMRVVVAKAALSKARRDATFSVVPRALCKPIERAAREAAVGDAMTLEKRRARIIQWIAHIGIEPERVFSALEISGPDDITAELLATLTGLRTAIKDGDVTIEEAFPPIASTTPSPAAAAAAKAAERARGRPKTTDDNQPAAQPSATKPQQQAQQQTKNEEDF